ncbi:short chain dehydrogenase [Streptomyces sp. BI20]|uniref:short chain dehydrogenase n=1 Tax=Streptomyces sp. BI20 TaxID=3403460 RepID=UPI003C746E53
MSTDTPSPAHRRTVLLIGARGTLGSAVRTALLARGHELVTASRSGEGVDHRVDITDPASIAALYDAVGDGVDAVANAAGWVPWAPLAELTPEAVRAGLDGKVLSQIELVRQGSARLPAHASFTLITGVLSRDALVTGSVAALANGAIEAWVGSAAVELPGRQRVNVVSPTVFEESMGAYGDLFAGFVPVPVAHAAAAYVRSVEGAITGRVLAV